MDGDACPAELFLVEGDASTERHRIGLWVMLERVAEYGWASIPSGWSHFANQQEGIYEFIKGRLRIFCFHGVNGQIAVCTTGVLKKGQKANKAEVAAAVRLKNEYFASINNSTLVVIENEDQ